MRLLANENVPGEAVDLLRAQGHEIVWVREDSPGSDDPVVPEGPGVTHHNDDNVVATSQIQIYQRENSRGLEAAEAGVPILSLRAG